MVKAKDTSILERVNLLREQWEGKAAKIEENEAALKSLSGELQDGDLKKLKSGKSFEGRDELVRRLDVLRDEIAQAKRDLPLLAQAINELGQKAIPEVVDGFVEWCTSHHAGVVGLAQEIVDQWHKLREAIRAFRSHRQAFEEKRAEVSAELKTFGCRNPEQLYPRSTFYPTGRSSMAVALKGALDVTFASPLDHRSSQAGIIHVEDLLKSEKPFVLREMVR